MTSRKAEANRRNASLSTGPKTANGKARVGQNARTHGLSVQFDISGPGRQRISALLKPLLDEVGALWEDALMAAEMDYRLEAIRTVKNQVVETALEQVRLRKPKDPAADCVEWALMLAGPQLLTLDRYEARAFSKRNKHLKRIERAKAASARAAPKTPKPDWVAPDPPERPTHFCQFKAK